MLIPDESINGFWHHTCHVGSLESRHASVFSSKAGGAFALPQTFVPAGNVGCTAPGGPGGEKPQPKRRFEGKLAALKVWKVNSSPPASAKYVGFRPFSCGGRWWWHGNGRGLPYRSIQQNSSNAIHRSWEHFSLNFVRHRHITYHIPVFHVVHLRRLSKWDKILSKWDKRLSKWEKRLPCRPHTRAGVLGAEFPKTQGGAKWTFLLDRKVIGRDRSLKPLCLSDMQTSNRSDMMSWLMRFKCVESYIYIYYVCIYYVYIYINNYKYYINVYLYNFQFEGCSSLAFFALQARSQVAASMASVFCQWGSMEDAVETAGNGRNWCRNSEKWSHFPHDVEMVLKACQEKACASAWGKSSTNLC